MDPVTVTIVSALAAGAAAAAKDVATTAIKDAYAGLKRLITDRYEGVAPFAHAVEIDPASEPERTVLAKQLDRAGAGQDEELKAAAQALLGAVEALHSDQRAAAMFDFGRLRAARNFELENIEAAGPVIRADEADIGGDFKAKGVRQSSVGGNGKKH